MLFKILFYSELNETMIRWLLALPSIAMSLPMFYRFIAVNISIMAANAISAKVMSASVAKR